MRIVTTLPEAAEELKATAEQKGEVSGWLVTEIENALSSRHTQEVVWKEAQRMYEGVSKNPVRNTPIENAPNIEVTLGAILADSIYAQVLDLVYTVDPVLTARMVAGGDVDDAKAMQAWVNYIALNEAQMRPASEHAFLDNVQLGTGIYYIPWIEHTKKGRFLKVIDRGPRIYALPVEDFLLPGSSQGDLQCARWCAARFWYTAGELEERKRLSGWEIGEVSAAGGVDWVQSSREHLGHTHTDSVRTADLYEIYEVYAYYDIDGDGLDEDLYIVWDRTSRAILYIDYNPYERRPFAAMRYQLRAHLFYGMGVIEMVAPYQQEATEEHNHRVINMMLANCRIWKVKTGQMPDNQRLWPNRMIELDDPNSLMSEQMADVYPSSMQAEAMTVNFAERRVGAPESNSMRPSQMLGSRTPGITALSALQQINKRFTPAFDGMRLGTAEAMMHCLYRYQERLLSGDRDAEMHILEVLGEEAGGRVVRVLKDERFDQAITVELTASSASVNREADKQNSIILANLLNQYYQGVLQLVMVASNPQMPPPVRDVATKIATAAGELIERTMRNFDQMRDPEAFVINMENTVDQLEGLPQEGLAMLGQLLGGAGAPGAGGDAGGAAEPQGQPDAGAGGGEGQA